MTTERRLASLDAELFVIGVLVLFLELALIRWIGTEIRIFAYLGNLLLVLCFFGVGLGCYLADRPASMMRLGLNLAFLVALVANPLHVSRLDLSHITLLLSGFEDSPVWEEFTSVSGLGVLLALGTMAVLWYLTTFIFVPAGQRLGQAFAKHPRLIRAYSFNILGSLAGAWLFNTLGWLSTPPVVWFAVATILIAIVVAFESPRQWSAVLLAGLATGLVALAVTPDARTVWSPYHKLTLRPHMIEEGDHEIQQGYVLQVNGTFYQYLLNLSDKFLRAHPTVFDWEIAQRSHYNLPFAFRPSIGRMLIVGAGTGNNAAAALRHGVAAVDCVEIDPAIYALGRELHPEHPYSDPRVHMIVNDARAFFKQATGHYDAIWFGLLDSHTLGSAYNNLRLDHYVYTLESLREARRLLADDGLVIINFEANRPWIADRLFGEFRTVFGQSPLLYRLEYPARYGTGGGVTLIGGNQPITVDRLADPDLRAAVREAQLDYPGNTRPSTDDWPYLYLERARVPKLHGLVSLALVSTVLVAQRRLFGAKRGLDWHFFALGAAFLLLEVQTVSRSMLLFGMTWSVNAIVISAVLLMILFANLVAARWSRLPGWVVVIGLAVTVAALAAAPLDWFNTLAATPKLLLASVFLTAPIFFAGLIFIRSFAICHDKPRALGSNLIGALVGGLFESLAFVTGIRALLVLVALFYLAAVLSRPRAAAG